MVSLQFSFVVLSVTACRQRIENVKVDGRVISFFHCVLNTFFWLYGSVGFEGNSTYAN